MPDCPEVERLPLADLTPDPANVRLHTERNQSAVVASLKRFGPGRSIVLDGDNVIIAGNQTVESAAQAGISEVLIVEPGANQIVAVRRPEWSKTEATGYAIADNRSAEHATWDFRGLAAQIGSLERDGVNLNDLGWAPHEVEPMLSAEWTPPPKGDPSEATGDGGRGDDDSTRTITFSPEAWRVIKQACDKIRESEEDDSITDGRAIELIIADWLSGA